MKKNISRIAVYAAKYRHWVILCAMVCLANSAISIIIGNYIRNMIDFIVEKQGDVTTDTVITGVVIVAAGVAISFLQTYCSGYFGVYICRDLRKRIADKVQSLPPKTIEVMHSGEIVSRINYDLPVIQSFFSETIPAFIYNPVVLAGTIIYLSYIDWRLLLVTTCLIPLTIFLSSKSGVPVRKYAKARAESEAKKVATAKDIISGIHISKAFNLQDVVFQKYKDAADELIHNHYLYEKKLAVLTPFMMIIRLVPFFSVSCLGDILQHGIGLLQAVCMHSFSF